MSYCNSGVQATVYYKIGSKNRNYITKSTPIDVAVTTLPNRTYGGGQTPNARYVIVATANVNSVRVNPGHLQGIQILGKITKAYISYEYKEYNRFLNVDLYTVYAHVANDQGIDEKRGVGSTGGDAYNSWDITEIYNRDDISESEDPDLPKCKISVYHFGNLIFSDSGNCPITFDVVCGEECPPHTIKCFKSDYPGYCCLPCNEIKQEIKAIASQVRSINNG